MTVQDEQDQGWTKNGQPQEPEPKVESPVFAGGVMVRKRSHEDGAVPVTVFDVIVHTGKGRKNAERVAALIRETLAPDDKRATPEDGPLPTGLEVPHREAAGAEFAGPVSQLARVKAIYGNTLPPETMPPGEVIVVRHEVETPEPDEYDTDTASNMADLAGSTIPAPDGYDGLRSLAKYLIGYQTTNGYALARLLREHEALTAERNTVVTQRDALLDDAADLLCAWSLHPVNKAIGHLCETVETAYAALPPLHPEDSTDGR